MRALTMQGAINLDRKRGLEGARAIRTTGRDGTAAY